MQVGVCAFISLNLLTSCACVSSAKFWRRLVYLEGKVQPPAGQFSQNHVASSQWRSHRLASAKGEVVQRQRPGATTAENLVLGNPQLKTNQPQHMPKSPPEGCSHTGSQVQWQQLQAPQLPQEAPLSNHGEYVLPVVLFSVWWRQTVLMTCVNAGVRQITNVGGTPGMMVNTVGMTGCCCWYAATLLVWYFRWYDGVIPLVRRYRTGMMVSYTGHTGDLMVSYRWHEGLIPLV